jgi:hypothetical protein
MLALETWAAVMTQFGAIRKPELLPSFPTDGKLVA